MALTSDLTRKAAGMERYIATQFYKADSPESRILGESGLVPSEFVLAADAQRALDAEREKVKELVANQAEYEKCTDEQITALNQGCLDYEKQIATLQAQLADRDAMILQMGEQAARLAKDGIAAKAQLRQVEGDAETYRKMHAVCTMNLALANNDLTTLRQLVEALPVVDGRMDVECGACYYIRSFVAEQYGVVCGLITEQSTAMAIKALLEYRATLAAGQVSTSIIGKQVPPSQWDKNAGVRGDIS